MEEGRLVAHLNAAGLDADPGGRVRSDNGRWIAAGTFLSAPWPQTRCRPQFMYGMNGSSRWLKPLSVKRARPSLPPLLPLPAMP